MEPTRTPLAPRFAARAARSLAAAPAVPLALAALAGTALGRHAVFAPPGPLILLTLLGLALAVPRRAAARDALLGVAGLSLAALAAGFLNGHLRGGGSTRGAFVPDRERPVAAVVEVTGHWRRLDEVWSAPVRLVSLRQGERVVEPSRSARGIEPLYLHVSAGAEGGAPPGPYGSTLRVKGVLDRPVRLGNPTPRPDAPPGPWRLKVKSRRLVTQERGPGPLGRLAGALRGRVEEGIGGAREGEGLGVPFARALLLGDGGDVPEPVKRAFRRLGLAHLLAVSGLHVGLVAGVALLLATPLGRSGRWLAALAAVGLYLLLVGPRPSLVRASVMASLGVAALLSHRPPSARNALALAAALMVALRPSAVSEPGLQLSVGATAGLLWLAPWLSERWRLAPGLRRLPRAVRDALAVSAGAQLGTLPWALPLFCLLVPAAPLVNLVAVPWAALLLVASGLWAGTACVAPGVALSLLPALDLLAAPAGRLATVPPSSWPSPWLALPVALGAGAATLLAVAVAIALGRPRIGLPVLAGALAWTVWAPFGGSDLPELVMIDVGQGDAILLRDGGETLLVDGGGWPAGDLGGRVLLPTLATLGVRSLDRVLATHFDRDHCGGLVQIAGYLPVAEVRSGPPTGDEADRCEAELAALPGPGHRVMTAGDRLTVGRWRVRALHPERAGPGASTRGGARAWGDNDASVVLVAEVHGRRVLLTGDVEAAGERELLGLLGDEPDALAADVLKVAHHGSRSSTTPRLLAAAAPSLALVSAGARNPYGHPAPDVLARLRASGARVLRTDRHGMVVLRFHPDGRREIALPGPL